MHILLGGLFLGVQMRKNQVTMKKRNSLQINLVEALIQFKKEHHGLLKLHVPLGEGEERGF